MTNKVSVVSMEPCHKRFTYIILSVPHDNVERIEKRKCIEIVHLSSSMYITNVKSHFKPNDWFPLVEKRGWQSISVPVRKLPKSGVLLTPVHNASSVFVALLRSISSSCYLSLRFV